MKKGGYEKRVTALHGYKIFKTSLNYSTGGTSAPGFAYAYDLGGNRTQEQTLGTLVYAAHNELNQVTGLAPTSQTSSVRT